MKERKAGRPREMLLDSVDEKRMSRLQ